MPSTVEGAEGDAPPKKQRGKPKDPLAPPKPKNGYQQFTEKRRPQLKEEKPELAADLAAFGKQMAEDWGAVAQEEKDKRLACAGEDFNLHRWPPVPCAKYFDDRAWTAVESFAARVVRGEACVAELGRDDDLEPAGVCPGRGVNQDGTRIRSEEHTSELQSP